MTNTLDGTMLSYTGELIVLTCWCGIAHAVPEGLRKEQLRKKDLGVDMSIYCPLGHGHIPSGQSVAAGLREQLAREKARHDQTKSELEHTERQRRGEKAAKTRIKNRIANGVCPCCHRSFSNLGAHMQGQHPDWKES